MLIGPHVNRYHATEGKRPSITEHIIAARTSALDETGFQVRAVAIFVGGPKNREITMLDEECLELKTYIKNSGVKVVAHSAYSAYPWRGDPDAARFILEELKICHESGITGLVVHLPKLPVANVLKYIGRLKNHNYNVRIYLETPAVTPAETYYDTPTKILNLFAGIRSEIDQKLEYFGLCIDTAHLWVNGIQLQSFASADNWLQGLEDGKHILPPSCVIMHLNDSLRPCGVGPDAHAGLTMGKIWEDYSDNIRNSGIMAFLDYAARHRTIVILERKPKETLYTDYRILKQVIP